MRNVLVPAVVLAICGTAAAQDYVGDETCATCHSDFPTPGFFDAYRRSGHPWKVLRTGGEVPPADTWPFTVVPPLPYVFGFQLEWSDVEYTIGNYFWKTRFIDRDGFIWTGAADDSTQWNLETQEFVPYHAGEIDKPFDCGRCHTTGYDPDGGNQHGLPGLIGTWEEDGVRCEACHGPSSSHVADPENVAPPGGKECADCHYRDAAFRMPWKGGFGRHHQQSEDLAHSAHKDVLTCESCHDPHRSVVYNDGGTIAACQDCHEGDVENDFFALPDMESVVCIDCHMPFMSKSATKSNEFTGDIRGHLFNVMKDPIFAVDNVYDDGGSLFWNVDAEGEGAATLDYACMGCHMDADVDIPMAGLAAYSRGIHTRAPISFGTSLHATRDGKNYWYGTENGGFETFTGVPIEELGCEECHGPANADGETYAEPYEPGCIDCHRSSDWGVEQSQCLSCHGRQAIEINMLGYSDVHRDAGMVCWDCHSTTDIHGDETAHESMLEPGAISADCEDCHADLSPDHVEYDPHQGKIHCSACHTQTVVSCYNCHFESQVQSHVKRAKQPLHDFVMLVNREKDGKVYSASFQSLTNQGDGFVAFAPFTGHSTTRNGRTCGECHDSFPQECRECHGSNWGTNAAITEYNETGAIKFADWDDDTKTLSWVHGIVPMPEDYQDTFRMDFLTFTGDPSSPPPGDPNLWVPTGKDTWDGSQMFFATPLTRDQMDDLGFDITTCPADIDGSGLVDFPDLLAVLIGWGPCMGECPADVNETGAVDFDDLLLVLVGWGECP